MMLQPCRRAVVLLLVSGWGSPSWAQERSTPNEIAPLVEEFCYRCHGPQTQSAGINLATLVKARPLVRNRHTWNRVVGVLDVKRMPPPGAPQPSDAVRDEMLAILGREIRDFDYSTIDRNTQGLMLLFDESDRLVLVKEGFLRDLMKEDDARSPALPLKSWSGA